MSPTAPGDATSPEEDGDETASGTGSAGSPEFDWRGWTLVATIVVAFLVVPGLILYLPAARGAIQSLGLTMRDAYLVLPLLPAFALGGLAVWSAVRSRST